MILAATILATVGALLSFLVGMGAGLSEDPGAWSFFVLGALFTAIGILCALSRGR